MPTISQQAVRDIQRRRSLAPQRHAQGQLRLWRPVVAQQRLGDLRCGATLPQYQRQGPRGIAQITADTQQVARLRATTGQRQPGRDTAKHGDGQAQRATGSVAAHQAHATTLGHGVQTLGIALQPIGRDRRCGECKGKGKG